MHLAAQLPRHSDNKLMMQESTQELTAALVGNCVRGVAAGGIHLHLIVIVLAQDVLLGAGALFILCQHPHQVLQPCSSTSGQDTFTPSQKLITCLAAAIDSFAVH